MSSEDQNGGVTDNGMRAERELELMAKVAMGRVALL
jgi:hypothetical protein